MMITRIGRRAYWTPALSAISGCSGRSAMKYGTIATSMCEYLPERPRHPPARAIVQHPLAELRVVTARHDHGDLGSVLGQAQDVLFERMGDVAVPALHQREGDGEVLRHPDVREHRGSRRDRSRRERRRRRSRRGSARSGSPAGSRGRACRPGRRRCGFPVRRGGRSCVRRCPSSTDARLPGGPARASIAPARRAGRLGRAERRHATPTGAPTARPRATPASGCSRRRRWASPPTNPASRSPASP